MITVFLLAMEIKLSLCSIFPEAYIIVAIYFFIRYAAFAILLKYDIKSFVALDYGENVISFSNIPKQALIGTFTNNVTDDTGKKYIYDPIKKVVVLPVQIYFILIIYAVILVPLAYISYTYELRLLYELGYYFIAILIARYLGFVFAMKKHQSGLRPKPEPFDDSYKRL